MCWLHLDPFFYLFDDYIWYLRTVNTSVGRHNRDVACRQAREPREKIVCLHCDCWISPIDWTSYYCVWFIPSTRRYKDQTLSLTFLQNRVAYFLYRNFK